LFANKCSPPKKNGGQAKNGASSVREAMSFIFVALSVLCAFVVEIF